MLISVGWLPPCLSPSGAFLALNTSIATAAPNKSRGLHHDRGCVSPLSGWKPSALSSHRDLSCDIPQERGHLSSDGDGHLIGVLAASDEPPVALAESDLGLPGDLPGEVRRPLKALL